MMVGEWILREVLFDEEGNPIAHREPVRETVRETGIVKVAVNTIYGGFGLSEAAQLRYKDLTGNYIDIYNIPRDDKVLIQVIEELGRSASADYSRIRIVEVPLGTNWDILDYDGLEMVIDTDRVWRGHD